MNLPAWAMNSVYKQKTNLLLDTDSYKFTHWKQYPPRTQYVHSYFESRGGKWPTTVFFGLQAILLQGFTGKVVTRDKINEASELIEKHIGPGMFNRAGWMHILERHEGRLPIKIRAVQEGTEVPVSNVLLTIQNTDPAVPWLTNFLETALMRLWYPLTVATQSNEFKKLWQRYLGRNGTPALIDYKLHDFGCRGVSCGEQAALGGLAHLLSFKGTDTVPALIAAREFYGADCAGHSIPASEHSTITAWGAAGELAAYENMLTQYPSGPVACVSDSYNIFEACSNLWGKLLKDKVLARDGVLVIRPDSGDPATIVLDVIRRLDQAFGITYNSKGYKVLNDKIRILQGDGVDLESAEVILRKLDEWKYSSDNVALGSGGALLQKLNRDTLKCAIKASAVVVEGQERHVSKNPITDSGKKSKGGRLKLCKKGDQFYTAQTEDPGTDYLKTVFENGEMKELWTLQQCREQLENTRITQVSSYVHPEKW